MKRNRLVFCLVLLLALCACRSGGQAAAATREVGAIPGEENLMFGYLQRSVTPYKEKESGAAFDDTPVTFQDAAVEGWIRGFLAKPEGEILYSDLQPIHAIYCRSESLVFSNLQSEDALLPPAGKERDAWLATLPEVGRPETLADLALCSNLQYLELYFGSELPSLAPLAELPQLESLYLKGESLTAAHQEELALLPHLTMLTISWPTTGEERDLEFLLPLADRLQRLRLFGIRPDTAVLGQLQALRSLHIDMPQDLEFLASLPNLQALGLTTDLRVDASYVQIDWSSVPWPAALTHLGLSFSTNYQPEITVEDLQAIPGLRYLSLTGVGSLNLTRSQLAARLPKLEGLDLH